MIADFTSTITSLTTILAAGPTPPAPPRPQRTRYPRPRARRMFRGANQHRHNGRAEAVPLCL
jgi:hypothetical protein